MSRVDELVHLECWEDHLDRLKKVLMDTQRAGLTAKPKKSHLGLLEAQYLGYSICRGLIKSQEQK